MILDYSTYVTQSATKGAVNFTLVEEDQSFFQDNSICPFCNIEIDHVVHQGHRDDAWPEANFIEEEKVIQCPRCGWWQVKYSGISDAVDDGIAAKSVTLENSILRKYDLQSQEVPVTVLNDYLIQHPDKINAINPHKTEELVQSIFSDVYQCEVKRTGNTRDGGYDLYFVNGDVPTFVEVKNRRNPKSTEAVSGIRELFGVATLRADKPSCIFVTTADHFSKEARDTAKLAVSRQKVQSYDLIDLNSFIDMLNLKSKNDEPWLKALRIPPFLSCT